MKRLSATALWLANIAGLILLVLVSGDGYAATPGQALEKTTSWLDIFVWCTGLLFGHLLAVLWREEGKVTLARLLHVFLALAAVCFIAAVFFPDIPFAYSLKAFGLITAANSMLLLVGVFVSGLALIFRPVGWAIVGLTLFGWVRMSGVLIAMAFV